MVVLVQARRQNRPANPPVQCRDVITNRKVKWLMPSSQEKPLSLRYPVTVPQTDTGGLGENPKALETTRVKELGKIVP